MGVYTMSDNVASHEGTLGKGPWYRVRLDVFEGPLDVLLRLIEDRQLDITKVSLALVTDNYLEYVRSLSQASAEDLAGFLVVAAKLLLIKSRALLPARPGEVTEEEDAGDQLARQLMEYKHLKSLAQALREREDSGLRSYVRVAPPPTLERKLDPAGVTLDDLMVAVRAALAVKVHDGPVDTVVAPLVVTIGDLIKRIRGLMTTHGQFSFGQLLREARSRLEVIVSFLAVLELVKAREVMAEQGELFGEILIVRMPEAYGEALGTVSPSSDG